MKIVNIKKVGKKEVYDLSVKDAEHYVLENGVITHNTGIYYSSDAVWIIGRRQQKTGQEVTGYDFIINIDKSRHVKEKAKIPISVSWEGGVEYYSGLLDVALHTGYVTNPSKGWYQKPGGQKVRQKDTLTSEFWKDILEREDFISEVENLYKIGGSLNVDLELEEDNE